ncbi:MAG: hypothetical protein GF393_03660 [Armatimonadia bacterium]|nr:hypothetical protein [Armatimonadia bacterium]
MKSPIRSLTPLCALVILAACATGALAQPLVGLAGMKYRRAYAPVLERLGVRAKSISGDVLEDRAKVAEYDALIIVNKGDPGQEHWGLTGAAQAVLTDYLQSGGRALLTYGAAPPEAIISGDFHNYGHGPHWLPAESDHPIVEGWEAGRVVQFGRYRGGIRDLGEGAEVLVREESGHPIVFAMPVGEGALVYAGGDLGHAGAYDGTTAELRDRVLRWVVFGRVQARFGPELTSRGPLTQYEPVHTARELASEAGGQQPTLCSVDVSAPPAVEMGGGYALEAGDGPQWVISAPEGRQVFAPWETIMLGQAPVQAGLRYEVTGEVRLAGVSPDSFVAARFEMRFFDAEGVELTHEHLTTDDPAPGEWQELRVSDVAPDGATRAAMALTVMLPAGELRVRSAALQQVMKTEELMAAEEPLSTDVPHPRLLPEAAAEDFQAWVAGDEQGVYGTSRAELFAGIVERADGYLQETEMTFGDTPIPWPPAEIPEGEGGTRWNPMTGGITSRLLELAVAYQGTGDERYGRRAVELLLAISNWPVWYDPVNDRPSLDVGRMSQGAAWAYDLCYDLMTDEERAKAAQALRRNTLIPLYEALSRGMGNLNSSALWMIGLGSAAVATLGEVEGAALCTRAVEDFALAQLDRRATSHPIEGMGYDSWSYGNILVVLGALERNFGVDHFDHPFFDVLPHFAVAFLGNDRKQHAWLEDAGGSVAYVHWHYPLTILGAVTEDPMAGWYLAETGTVGLPRQDAFKLLYFDPRMPVSGPDDDAPGAVFPKAGWASLRSGWERGGTFIAFVCSDSGTGHAQRHQNTFLVYRDSTLMTTDPGYASGTSGAVREYTRGTVGHNSVLVDGTDQMYKLGRMPHFASNRAVDYAMGDATAAYSASLLTRFHRHLVYVKPDLLFVIDDLRAPQPRTYQWILHPNSRLHTVESITADGEALKVGGEAVAGPVHVVKEDKRMRVRSLAPEGLGFRYVVYPGAEEYNPYLQIDHPAAESTVLVSLLEFGETTAEDATCEVANGSVAVDFSSGGADYALDLRLAGDDGSGPLVRVTRDGEALMDEAAPDL